jgi:hypothetical protein
MIPLSAYLYGVLVSSAVLGLWLCARLPRLAPTSGRGAVVCFGLSLAAPLLAAPLLALALHEVRPSFALLLTVLPSMVCAFALAASALRYLAETIGHRIR